MKKWLINSWFGFDLIQMKSFRKWYGGGWTRLGYIGELDINVWIQGSPDPSLLTNFEIIKTESYL